LYRSAKLAMSRRKQDARHLLDDFQAGTLAILFTGLGIGVDNFVVEFTDGLL
jgi:hypothetical protein